MLSPRQHRVGFTVLFLAACASFGAGFVLMVMPLVAAGFFGSLGALLWGVSVTGTDRRPQAEAAPAGDEDVQVTFEIVSAPPKRAPPPRVPAPPADALPWVPPADAPVVRVPVAAPAPAAPLLEWARPAGAVGGEAWTARYKASATRSPSPSPTPAPESAPRYSPLGRAVTRGVCGKCRTPLTLSDRRPLRATCPVCGHSRVLE